MNNNDILKKLRVAIQLRDDQIVTILQLVDFRISTTELGAFFRAEDHPNYRPCGDQVLRNFLNGLIIYLRGTKEAPKNPMEVINTHKPNTPNSGTLRFNKTEPLTGKPKDKNKKYVPGDKQNNSLSKDGIKAVPKNKVVEKVRFNNGKNKKNR